MASELPTLESLAELERVLAEHPGLCIRYSEHVDVGERSVDSESGLTLPGLSVNPLEPESWWSRPATDWLARQLCQYRHLSEQNPDRFAWVLTGVTVARGPDCEPLIADGVPHAVLSEALLEEADRRYHETFDAERGPED